MPWTRFGRSNPATQAVTLRVGTFTTTIPPGSFKPIGSSFYFAGTINGVALQAGIAPLPNANQYAFAAAAEDANLTGTANPVTVTLTIGDNADSASVNALIATY